MRGLFPWLWALLFGEKSQAQCTSSDSCGLWRDLRCGSGCCAKHCASECKGACLRADADGGVLELPPARTGAYR